MNKNLEIAIIAALKAGDVIMNIYGTDDFKIENKIDNSPLTIADKEANDIINSFLILTGLSRVTFREMANQGLIPRYVKSKILYCKCYFMLPSNTLQF